MSELDFAGLSKADRVARKATEVGTKVANRSFGYRNGLKLALTKLNIPEDVRVRMMDAAAARDFETFTKLLEVKYV